MKIGCTRVSTKEQSFDLPLDVPLDFVLPNLRSYVIDDESNVSRRYYEL